MKSIFLCEDKPCITRVFSEQCINKLVETTELDTSVYNKEEILNNSEKFQNVEFIFSTWGMPSFTNKEIADCFPQLKCIFYAAGTVKFFARNFLEAGVKVFSAWAANAIPVAETAMSLILLANKGFFQTSRVYKKQSYIQAREILAKCAGNFDTNVGLIGVGMIGTEVAELLNKHRLNLFAYDPFLSHKKAQELNITKCDLPTLFKSCITISNHLADNEQTRGLLNENLFSLMPSYATFINTGRGAQVIESDLINVLKKRPDLTAVLDVTCAEPLPDNNPFYKLENCILTPHIAGSQNKEVCRMADYMVQEYMNYIHGNETRYEVTLDSLKTMA